MHPTSREWHEGSGNRGHEAQPSVPIPASRVPFTWNDTGCASEARPQDIQGRKKFIISVLGPIPALANARNTVLEGNPNPNKTVVSFGKPTSVKSVVSRQILENATAFRRRRALSLATSRTDSQDDARSRWRPRAPIALPDHGPDAECEHPLSARTASAKALMRSLLMVRAFMFAHPLNGRTFLATRALLI